MSHVLSSAKDQDLLKPYANLLSYLARCTDRPAWKRTLDAYFERVEAA
jgi:glutathione S-transferase